MTLKTENVVIDISVIFVRPVVLWDPLHYFSNVKFHCPSCNEDGISMSYLKPIRWKDGSRSYERPRKLVGMRCTVLLVSRLYMCGTNDHQMIAHDAGILSQLRHHSDIPFILFHKSGVTRELYDYISRGDNSHRLG